MIIAIQPDDYTAAGKSPKSDSASYRWAQFIEKAGHQVRWVNVRRADIVDQLRGCDGFMWRWAHFNGMARIARRLLPVVERELKLPVYPDQNTCWHYDDKIAQAYLFEAAGIASPKTWVWFDRQEALAWLEKASFPMVLKLATGASSSNVVLVRSREKAAEWVHRLFQSYHISFRSRLPRRRQIVQAIKDILSGNGMSPLRDNGFEPQAGYVYFQEFLEGNDFDNRVTVIGNRAFAFRRFNREGDFRASGSGMIDYDADAIREEMIRLAFKAAWRLGMQSCAIDGFYRDRTPVIGEVSYTYVSSAVHECPGHWVLDGTPETGELRWTSGQMWPEEAQVSDFLQRFHLAG